MRTRLIELLKADIETYELQPFTTPHLSRIAQKEQELLLLLEKKYAVVADETHGGPEPTPPTPLNEEDKRLYLGGCFDDSTPTERLVADASLLRRELRLRAGLELGDPAFPGDSVETLKHALEIYVESLRKRLGPDAVR